MCVFTSYKSECLYVHLGDAEVPSIFRKSMDDMKFLLGVGRTIEAREHQ